jgi:hypothetical protein
MTNDEIAEKFAEHMNRVIEGITGPLRPNNGVVNTKIEFEATVDFIKEQAFSQGYDLAIKNVLEIINKQQEINDKLGRIGGEDLHVIRTKINEMYI